MMRPVLLALLIGLPGLAAAHDGAHPPAAAEQVFAPEALTPAAVTLRDQSGRLVSFSDQVVGDGPVIMTFVYSNCATVCPTANALLQVVQSDLDAIGDDSIRLVSVSIDPGTDTPEKMATLADQLGAGPRWSFITGGTAEMDRALRSMGARPDSVTEHDPMFLIRSAPGGAFTRVLGLPGPEALIAIARPNG